MTDQYFKRVTISMFCQQFSHMQDDIKQYFSNLAKRGMEMGPNHKIQHHSTNCRTDDLMSPN